MQMTARVLSDGDFHPIVGAHSQAHAGPPNGRSVQAGKRKIPGGTKSPGSINWPEV